MNSEWKPIGIGFVVAGVGTASAMLYIVGLSSLYIGRYRLGVATLVGAVLLAIAFRKWVGAYLDELNLRTGGTDTEADVDVAAAENPAEPPAGTPSA